jgi:uncharacterized integral membrane protein
MVVGFWIFAGFYTDLLWFRSVGFTSVYTTELKTRLLLFAFFGVLMGAAVGASCWIAFRSRPAFRGLSAEQQGLDRYRVAVDPYRRPLTIAVSTLLGLIAGGPPRRSGDLAGVPQLDPVQQQGRAVPRRPVVLHVPAAVLALPHRLRLRHRRRRWSRRWSPTTCTAGCGCRRRGRRPAARRATHIAVLLGLFVALKAVAYWYDRYGLVTQADGNRITGATYTDVNALIPAKEILFVIAIICALLFFATVVTRNWLAPGLGFGLLVLSAVVVGGIYPAFVQSSRSTRARPTRKRRTSSATSTRPSRRTSSTASPRRTTPLPPIPRPACCPATRRRSPTSG